MANDANPMSNANNNGANSDILDSYGQPFRKATLSVPQTEGLARASSRAGGMGASRYQRMDGEANEGGMGGIGGVRAITPALADSILRNRGHFSLGEMATLAREMEERDAHLHAEMSKRRRALLTVKWHIEAKDSTGQSSRSAKKLAAQAQSWLAAMPDFEDLILDCMDAVGHGFAALELEWTQGQIGQDLWSIAAAKRKPPSFFMLNPNSSPPGDRRDLRLIDDQITAGAAVGSGIGSGNQGIELQPLGWLIHIHRAKSGSLAHAGLYRHLLWAYVYKHFSERDWAEFLETYGQPLRTASYPATATPQQRSALMRSLLSLGHNAAGIFPEGMGIELHDAVGGQADGFERMAERMDKLMSKLILGQTLTAGADKSGSYALGKVHREVQNDILKSDARQLAGTLTRELVYPLLVLNCGITSLHDCPRFVFDIQDTEDLQGLANVITPLANAGVKIPVQWVHEKFGIPHAQEGDEVLQAVVQPKPPTPTPKPEQQANSYLPAVKGLRLQTLSAKDASPELDTPAKLAPELQAAAQVPFEDMLSKVKAVVDQATSLESLRDDLLSVYGGLDPKPLADVMALGFLSAKLRGMSEVKDEAKRGTKL